MGGVNKPFLCILVPTYMVLSTESYQKWSPVPMICPQKIHMGEKKNKKTKNKGGREKRERQKNQQTYTHVRVCAGIGKGLEEII